MVQTISTAEAFLRILGKLDVTYLFGNAGTDAAPLIEAYARCDADPAAHLPQPILATHENLAVSMAHGYAMVSGQLPAVFVHVSVGTANAVCPIMNAARENVPILFAAGRTPIYEDESPGSRDSYIHWGQEMFDQASLVREFVKWDYELRGPAQVETVVRRAASLALSEPKGPVYLSLPREVLAAPMPAGWDDNPVCLVPSKETRPSQEGVAAAADILARAGRPLIIAGNSGRHPPAVADLVAFAERFQIPVVQHRSRYLPFPSDHPLHLGFDPGPLVTEADAILVLESDVPWIPKLAPLRPECRVIHAGYDPLFGGIPIRGFRCDLALTGDTAALLHDLTTVSGEAPRAHLDARQSWVSRKRDQLVANRAAAISRARMMHPIHPAWVSHCLGQVKGNAIVVNEYSLMPDHCAFTEPGTYFGSSSASGLGWGMGAALGAKLAAPDRVVIATSGDGAYIFANPVACHYAARQHKLPVLFVIINNAMWGAVRQATLKVYPDGIAARTNQHAMTRLDDLPAFEEICASAGGYGERVEQASDLPGAFARALKAVTHEGRQALLNIICQP